MTDTTQEYLEKIYSNANDFLVHLSNIYKDNIFGENSLFLQTVDTYVNDIITNVIQTLKDNEKFENIPEDHLKIMSENLSFLINQDDLLDENSHFIVLISIISSAYKDLAEMLISPEVFLDVFEGMIDAITKIFIYETFIGLDVLKKGEEYPNYETPKRVVLNSSFASNSVKEEGED